MSVNWNSQLTINQASKIFIYNEEVENDTEKSEPKNTSSITILTSGAPCHIRIKNSYKSEAIKSNNEEAKSSRSSSPELRPKSEQLHSFSMNEDVLMKSGDDKFYLGTVVNINNERKKYLVKFDDNTEKWASEQKLKKLNSSLNKSEHDDPLCVVCKVKSDNDVVEVCHKCSRGYHRYCTKQDSLNLSSPWCCDRCTASEIISISDSDDNEPEEEVCEELKFSYNIKALKWDSHHRENKQEVYCYCGKTGVWKKQMLQCCKCHQWFHDQCLSIRKRGYLMHGDMFFAFCCKICNDGNEFIQRLVFSWKTALHLVLYELSTIQPQKFYSVTKEIVPFIWEKWDSLNLPFDKYHSKDKLARKIWQVVKNADEFKSLGKKKSDSVYLRRKTPPVVYPKLNIPHNINVSEKTLKKLNIKTVPLTRVAGGGETNENAGIIKDTKVHIRVGKRRRKSRPALAQDIQNFKNTLQADIADDSSDENSSKSALDWIIPPPTNFHGRNNPFHSLYKSNAKGKKADLSGKKGNKSVFEKLPEIRIVRTIKRRLSAKDIAMGQNQEAKRRKFMKRRKSSDVQIISEIIQPISMPLPTFIPVRGGGSEIREFSRILQTMKETKYEFGDENAASKTEENVKIKTMTEVVESCVNDGLMKKHGNVSVTDSVINSPVKNKSINLYFGALNRIENGENFTILAKRLTFDGKEQFLLEWNNNTQGASKIENH